MNQKAYMIVAGRGKNRRILEWYNVRTNAVIRLNHFILDYRMNDCRLVISSIIPPFEAGPRASV